MFQCALVPSLWWQTFLEGWFELLEKQDCEPGKLKMASKTKVVLLDIEGTTSSIKFVHDVLFPYARAEVGNYLRMNWISPKTKHAIESMAKDLGHSNTEHWALEAKIPGGSEGSAAFQKVVEDHVNKLMDQDVKVTGLKELQGLIWDVGYNEGKLCSHVYDDVPTAMRAWDDAGIDVRIYSSGSISAQKVFFKHTECGDLGSLLRGYYDTTIGPKKESQSYKNIAKDIGIDPSAILFLSDVEAELEAAQCAGMQVALVRRPGNEPVNSSLPAIKSFCEIEI